MHTCMALGLRVLGMHAYLRKLETSCMPYSCMGCNKIPMLLTGSGKTAAFSENIPVLTSTLYRERVMITKSAIIIMYIYVHTHVHNYIHSYVATSTVTVLDS